MTDSKITAVVGAVLLAAGAGAAGLGLYLNTVPTGDQNGANIGAGILVLLGVGAAGVGLILELIVAVLMLIRRR